MLGHSLLQNLAGEHEVKVTVRNSLNAYLPSDLFRPDNTYDSVDIRDSAALHTTLRHFKPHAIINAAGIVKQRKAAKDHISSIEINALFPHRLAAMAAAESIRLFQVSTDCVFSGRRGHYQESDLPDPFDLYGRTKLLGEVDNSGCVTLRTSIIGLEVASRQGLVEWALSQHGEIGGYVNAMYSGVTTRELARVLNLLLTRVTTLHGVWHVASEPISKFNLLTSLFGAIGRTDVTVVPDYSVSCDRTLDGSAFSRVTGYVTPPWQSMLDELAADIRHREATTYS